MIPCDPTLVHHTCVYVQDGSGQYKPTAPYLSKLQSSMLCGHYTSTPSHLTLHTSTPSEFTRRRCVKATAAMEEVSDVMVSEQQ